MTVLTYDEAMDAMRSFRMGEVANPFPDWPAVAPRKDALPQSWVPVATPVDFVPGRIEVQELTWGYPVEWKQGTVYNTRIESMLQDSRMWGDAGGQKRCVVPVVRFYEHHKSEAAISRITGRRVKRAYEFQLVDEPVTWLAGIFEDDHFSIVTTEPNDLVAPIHDRMPIVLRQFEVKAWLGEDFAQLADRSRLALSVLPEPIPEADEQESTGDQLSLF